MGDETEKPTLTLAQLADELGPYDADLWESRMTPAARKRYQVNGATIVSSRVLIDGERLMGLAWATWDEADDAKRERLVGFSPALLALGVHGALQLRQATAAADSDGHSDKVARVTTERAVAAVNAKTIALRDQAVTVVKTLVADDETLEGRLATAVGNAETPDNLATGTARVAALGKALVASTDKALVARVKAARVTAAYFDLVAAQAGELKAAVEAARPRLTVAKTSQGEIDVLDGFVLSVLSDVIHLFAAAQELDGTIPTLVPISARRLLASKNKRKPKPAPVSDPTLVT